MAGDLSGHSGEGVADPPLTLPIITSGIASVYCPSAASTVASPVANQIPLIARPFIDVGAPNSTGGARTKGQAAPMCASSAARLLAALAHEIFETT